MPLKTSIQMAENRRKRRLDVINGYGGACACCGETEPRFLSIDHVNGLRGERRPSQKYTFYTGIIRDNFPAKYQILCHNCNQAKGFYGICPHKEK